MIEITQLISRKAEYIKQLQDRQQDELVDAVDQVIKLDTQRRELMQKVEDLRAQRNQISEQIAQARSDKLLEQAQQIKRELKEIEPQYTAVEEQFMLLLKKLPNWIHADVPIGKDERENQVLRQWGEIPVFDFEVLDHLDLGESLDLIDVETSAKVAGTRFNYLKNEAVLLQFGLIQFVFATLTDKSVIGKLADQVGNPSARPFTLVLPPAMLKAKVAQQMDRFDPIEDRYYFPEDELLMAGSAEHTLGPMYLDTIIEEKELPIRLLGYSTAFRREAGSYGQDTRGIIRCHQFDKLEMECFTTAENGEVEQDLMVAIQEYLIQQLEIPYQVVAISTGDMGGLDFRQIDIECYLPAQGKYRETHTSDYMTDFQARRLMTRYRNEAGEIHFAHMNDATAFAMGRTLVAILENYQQADGSVVVPSVLREYVGKEAIEKGKGINYK